MSDQRLTEIVTGASSGLGLAIAKVLLSRDFNVVMNGSNQERLDAAYQSVGSPEAALPEEVLGRRVSLVSRLAVPAHRLGVVPRHD